MAAAPYELVMEDMLRGRDFAAQLQGLLRDSPKAGLIVDQILHAFSRAIGAAEDGCKVQSDDTCASGGGKRKAAAGGGGRASRRRTTQQSSVKTVTTKELEDGHGWRKYGQKEIQNCKHPKAYFRCTHKYDQHCAAQRQVQLCDDAPDTYRVTYIGVHTCRDLAAAAALPLVLHQAGALPDGSRLISFSPNATSTPTTSTTTTGTGNSNQRQVDHQEGASLLMRLGSAVLLPLKVEGGGVDQEEVLSSLTPAGSGRNPVAMTPGPDQGDVTSDLHFFRDGIVDDIFTMDDGTFDLEDIVVGI